MRRESAPAAGRWSIIEHMADKGVQSGVRPGERQRFRKLAQAALNADMTVDQVDTILADMGDALDGLGSTLTDLDGTIARMETTLTQLSTTLVQVDQTVDRMAEVVGRLEQIVGRVEAIVAMTETALRPLGALESAGRTMLARIGLG